LSPVLPKIRETCQDSF